ncbi:MAG: DUF6659 family protein [Nitrososphaerales archaeon]
MTEDIIDKMLNCHRKVRCAMLISEEGEVLKFACKPNVDIILTKEDLQRYAKQAAARKKERESWNEKMGSVECILAVREKLCILVFYWLNKIILLSIERLAPLAAVEKAIEVYTQHKRQAAKQS